MSHFHCWVSTPVRADMFRLRWRKLWSLPVHVLVLPSTARKTSEVCKSVLLLILTSFGQSGLARLFPGSTTGRMKSGLGHFCFADPAVNSSLLPTLLSILSWLI